MIAIGHHTYVAVAVQNVNKELVYITDLTSPVNTLSLFIYKS